MLIGLTKATSSCFIIPGSCVIGLTGPGQLTLFTERETRIHFIMFGQRSLIWSGRFIHRLDSAVIPVLSA